MRAPAEPGKTIFAGYLCFTVFPRANVIRPPHAHTYTVINTRSHTYSTQQTEVKWLSFLRECAYCPSLPTCHNFTEIIDQRQHFLILLKQHHGQFPWEHHCRSYGLTALVLWWMNVCMFTHYLWIHFSFIVIMPRTTEIAKTRASTPLVWWKGSIYFKRKTV